MFHLLDTPCDEYGFPRFLLPRKTTIVTLGKYKGCRRLNDVDGYTP